MTTGRAIHRADDGTETDITEAVQALYDLVISSMNWGSGFWDVEDAEPVARVAHLLDFKQVEEVDRYLAERRHDAEKSAWLKQHPEAYLPQAAGTSWLSGLWNLPPAVPHDHVFSSAGKCMWPRCYVSEH